MSDHLKVVPLAPRTKLREELIEALRACLAQAEQGDVTGFVLVTVKRGGDVMRAHSRSEECDAFKLLGVLKHEEHHLHHMIDQENAIVDHMDDPA